MAAQPACSLITVGRSQPARPTTQETSPQDQLASSHCDSLPQFGSCQSERVPPITRYVRQHAQPHTAPNGTSRCVTTGRRLVAAAPLLVPVPGRTKQVAERAAHCAFCAAVAFRQPMMGRRLRRRLTVTIDAAAQPPPRSPVLGSITAGASRVRPPPPSRLPAPGCWPAPGATRRSWR